MLHVNFVGAVHFCGLNEHRCAIGATTAQKVSKVVLLKHILEFWHEFEGFAESAPSSLIKSCPLAHDVHSLQSLPGNEERVCHTLSHQRRLY